MIALENQNGMEVDTDHPQMAQNNENSNANADDGRDTARSTLHGWVWFAVHSFCIAWDKLLLSASIQRL